MDVELARHISISALIAHTVSQGLAMASVLGAGMM